MTDRGDVNTKAHRSPARPFEIAKELAAVRPGLLQRLARHYRTAYLLGYSRHAGGQGQSQRTGHSDPTGDTAGEREWIRNTVAFAGEQINKAVKALDAADAALARVTEPRSRERLDNRILDDEIAAAKSELHKQTRRSKKAG